MSRATTRPCAFLTVLSAWLFGLAISSASEAQQRKSGDVRKPAVSDAAPAASVVQLCTRPQNDPPAVGKIAYFRDCPDTPEMATFNGGKFRMGDPFGNGLSYEKPVHEVHVAPFALGRYEVTIAEWQRCVNAKICGPLSPDNANKPTTHPVTGVSWDDAQEFVVWLTRRSGQRYRLPSEAEWEYAARAGSQDEYTWGNQADLVCRYANVLDESGHRKQPQMFWYAQCDDGYATTAPVGSYPPSAWGLYDMLGNVWEWVQDCWHSDYTDAPTDGSAWIENGDCSKRANRGGGWGNNPRALRVSNRDGDPQDSRSDGLGFRVARSVASAGH